MKTQTVPCRTFPLRPTHMYVSMIYLHYIWSASRPSHTSTWLRVGKVVWMWPPVTSGPSCTASQIRMLIQPYFYTIFLHLEGVPYLIFINRYTSLTQILNTLIYLYLVKDNIKRKMYPTLTTPTPHTKNPSSSKQQGHFPLTRNKVIFHW